MILSAADTAHLTGRCEQRQLQHVVGQGLDRLARAAHGLVQLTAYTGATTVFGTVWVYDSVVTGTPGKTGIEVYREHTGELAFASWAKPLRIVGVATSPFDAAGGAYVQVPTGRRYGVISSRSCQRIERNVGFRLAGPQGNGTGSGSAGRFYYAGAAALIPQADNVTQFSASGHFVLIDVTGH